MDELINPDVLAALLYFVIAVIAVKLDLKWNPGRVTEEEKHGIPLGMPRGLRDLHKKKY